MPTKNIYELYLKISKITFDFLPEKILKFKIKGIFFFKP